MCFKKIFIDELYNFDWRQSMLASVVKGYKQFDEDVAILEGFDAREGA